MSNGCHAQTLRDLGEQRIIKDLIVPRFPRVAEHIVGIGDDCAVIPSPPSNQVLVMTTDPCPTPVICLLEPPDLFHYGWMTVLINISDLAAMGAYPMGMMVSTVMPEGMGVGEYERFLDGVASASNEWACPIIGGNIKDGSTFTSTGSALGSINPEYIMRRTGAKAGDRVCIIGEMGLFWAAALTRLVQGMYICDLYKNDLERALYNPVARIREGIALAESKLATACMDSSDGVIACLREIASVNQVDVIVESSSMIPHPAVRQVAASANLDPKKLMLSWGNWELIVTIRPNAVDEVRSIMESLGTHFQDIGKIREGTGKVWIEEEGRYNLLTNFASERFCSTSFFTHGLDKYLEFLKSEPLQVSL